VAAPFAAADGNGPIIDLAWWLAEMGEPR